MSTDLEYDACNTIWLHVCKRQGAIYRQIETQWPYCPGQWAEHFFSQVSARTRVIYLSHITPTTALRLPVEEICAKARSQGILTLIDGAHGPGQMDICIESIACDFYVGNCHKWLCAPKGTGFLVAKQEHHDYIEAPVVSWGYDPEARSNPLFNDCLGGTDFEKKIQWQGTRDLAAWLSVPAAIQFQEAHNWNAVRSQCHDLAQHAAEQLQKRFKLMPLSSPSDWNQMVDISVPHSARCNFN